MKDLFMKKLNKSLKHMKNNRGSGIVTVIIAMMFLFSITSSLLVLTYSGFTMKTSQRYGNQVSVDATTAMDQIRVGLQNVVSDCMKIAYADSLTDYSYSSLGIQQKFAESYVNALHNYTVEIENEETHTIETVRLFSADNKKYNTRVVKHIVDTASGSDFEMNTATGAVAEELDVSENKVEGKIILKGVSVRAYEGKNMSIVTADIAIGVPSIGSKLSQLSMAGVPEFAIIAGGQISHNSNTPTEIDGCIYGDSLKLGMLSSMYLNSKAAVFKGLVSASGMLDNKARLTTSEDTTLWADTIRVHASTKIDLSGSSLIANDLDLYGTQAQAKLSGMYYGFGSDSANASKSSAILVNGRNSKIDISGLDNLTLSGFAFIYDDGPASTEKPIYTPKNVLMGESIAVKDNQRLYLAPVQDLQYREIEDNRPTGEYLPMKSNPEVFLTSTGFTSVKVSLKDRVLWQVDGHDYKYSSYGASVQTMGQPYGTHQSIAFYFLKFSTANGRTETENANLFFRHYFMNNPDEVTGYIRNYVTLADDPLNPAVLKTVGNSFISEEDISASGETLVSYEISKALDSVSASTVNMDSSMYQTMFNSVCTSLKYDIYDVDRNPFQHYILDDADEYIKRSVPTNGYLDLYPDETTNQPQIRLYNGNATINDSVPSSVILVIATGNVSVERDFTGCIMCGGTMDINASLISSDETGFEACYQWLLSNKPTGYIPAGETQAVDKCYAELIFRNSPIEENSWGDAGERAQISALVTFENWIKE